MRFNVLTHSAALSKIFWISWGAENCCDAGDLCYDQACAVWAGSRYVPGLERLRKGKQIEGEKYEKSVVPNLPMASNLP